ncbi:MAG: prolipoprotein diacylglyceryl transferase, partial [Deltaproteobacteria bacterium]|nr:prolipoprotein diacylglyceryl transferase [Deltaproteobacteria bacterium]
MDKFIFVAGLGALFAVLLWWSRRLPGERWQIAAAIPVGKAPGGRWRGLNITFYGMFTANAVLLAAALMLIMLGSLGISPFQVMVVMLPLISLSAPAARLVARWVEHKPATLTVAGAGFAALVLAPWLTLLARACLDREAGEALQVTPVLAALVICYTLGEGLGRLACLSFGCCYGRALVACPEWVQTMFKHWHLVFSGETKKISYESGLNGLAVVPVQMLTMIVNGAVGLVSLYMFLNGAFTAALWLCLMVSGLWRAVSETLRADYRGGGSLSAYQIMALAGIVYGILMSLIFPVGSGLATPSLGLGLDTLWSPAVVLSLQGLWTVSLIYSGASKV